LKTGMISSGSARSVSKRFGSTWRIGTSSRRCEVSKPLAQTLRIRVPRLRRARNLGQLWLQRLLAGAGMDPGQHQEFRRWVVKKAQTALKVTGDPNQVHRSGLSAGAHNVHHLLHRTARLSPEPVGMNDAHCC
jgi:hypothetical protein